MHRIAFLALATGCAARAAWSTPHGTSGAAALCGPPDHPCLVVRDETVAHLGFTNDAPSIAVDGDGRPAIAYSEATSGYHGYLARRTDGWHSDALPIVLASGLLAIGPDGAPRLVADDGAMHVSLWRGGDGGWHQEDTPGAHQSYARATGGYDGVGRLWTALGDDADHLSLAVRQPGRRGVDASAERERSRSGATPTPADDNGKWTLTPLWDVTLPHPVVAFGPDGKPQVASWGSHDGANGVFWSDGGTPELVEKVGNVIMSQDLALGVDRDGRPHMLFLRWSNNAEDLVYATRGDSGWTTNVIASGDSAGTRSCAQPGKGGATCQWTSDFVAPLVAVEGGGGVRLLYTVSHEAGTAKSSCSFSEAGEHCNWDETPSVHTSALMIAWPDGDHLASTAAATNVELATATAVVGPDGAIHVAGYQWSDDGKAAVRYLELSASAP